MKKKAMKKNVMMRVASALGVSVLLTTCAISGTFAKYTTSVNGGGTARVAKWGFEEPASVTINDLFNIDDANVASGNADKVIAPGTSKEVTFGFTYDTSTNGGANPEVAYTFEVTATGDCGATIKANNNIKWYLDGALAPAYVGTGTDGAPQYKQGSFDALKEAINALDGNKTDNKYEAGSLPTAFYSTDHEDGMHKIKWEWAYEATGEGATAQDETDTDMGNADTLETVSLTITITATQLD